MPEWGHVLDAEAPRVRLDVGVWLVVLVGVNAALAVFVREIGGLLLGVCVFVVVAVRVLVCVAVVDALAPYVRLPVGE